METMAVAEALRTPIWEEGKQNLGLLRRAEAPLVLKDELSEALLKLHVALPGKVDSVGRVSNDQESREQDALEVWVQVRRLHVPNVDLLCHVLASFDDLEELDNRRPLLVRQIECGRVRNPAMNSTSARIDPEEVLVAELVCERGRMSQAGVSEVDREHPDPNASYSLLSAPSRTPTAAAINPQHRLHISLS